MPIGQSLLLAGGRYIIQNSCRFRSEAAPKLTYTPAATPAERRKWTFSAWVRRSKLGTDLGPILYAGAGNDDTWIGFNASDQLSVNMAVGNVTLVTWASALKFRDTSGWFHIMVVADTTQAGAADRIKVYANGVQLSATGTPTYPAQNATAFTRLMESGWMHQIGQYRALGYHFDGEIAEHRVIPEVALVPSCFGEFVNGAWCPKAYNTTYGAYGLGWFLEFKNPAALGTDSSGAGHTFAPTSTPATDQLVDTPTTVYPTLDPLNVYLTPTLTNGGLTAAGNNTIIAANIGLPSTGKWVWEVTIAAAVDGTVGITRSVVGVNSRSNGYYFSSGNKWGGGWVANGAAWAVGSVLGVVVDVDAQTVNIYKDGVLQGTGFSEVGDLFGCVPYVEPGTSGQHTINFGQRPFAYSNAYGTAKALNTDNMREFSRRLSGTFIGTATSGDGGPEVWIGGKPETLLINGNAVIFGTHANARAGGFAVITSSSSYNASGSNTWTATVATAFVNAEHVPGPAVPNS